MAGSHQSPDPKWLITPRPSEKFFPKADAALNVKAKATMKSGTVHLRSSVSPWMEKSDRATQGRFVIESN